MKITKKIGMILLAVYLIAYGLGSFVPALMGLSVVWAIVAIAAGVLILLDM